jgi:hypothetical protein
MPETTNGHNVSIVALLYMGPKSSELSACCLVCWRGSALIQLVKKYFFILSALRNQHTSALVFFSTQRRLQFRRFATLWTIIVYKLTSRGIHSCSTYTPYQRTWNKLNYSQGRSRHLNACANCELINYVLIHKKRFVLDSACTASCCYPKTAASPYAVQG